MKKNNKLLAFICAAATAASGLTLSMPYNVFADTTKVVSIGNDLTDAQKKTMLKYFGIEGDPSVQRINVTNKDEISHLSSYIPLEQIGTRTVSCAYIKPTESGGIRVRTANLQYVTANMIASTLADLGIKNCEVVSACPFQVSGTGALTGIIMAYETATGETIDKAKKDIATQEVVVTKDLAKDIGNVQAEYVVNQAKIDAINGDMKDKEQIQENVTNIVNNNNINISNDQIENITNLTQNIVNENYDNSYTKNITEINNNIKQEIDASDDIDIDVDIEDTNADDDEELVPDDSITENLDDSLLGDNVIASSTDDASLIVDTAESSESTEESTESEDGTVEDDTDETDGDTSDDSDITDDADTTDIENDESETAPNGDALEPEETGDDEDDESTEGETSEASDAADDANTDTDADSDTETDTDADADADADADTDTDGDASNDAEKTCDSVEDGKDLDDIVIPEDGLSYFGYDINAIKDASDENTAKRFLQLENNMKEAFPFSLGNYADCLLNQGKLLDSETGEPLENVDESKLMSHITKYILATYENYILTRPTESLQSEFDDTIKSEIDEGSIQPEDEEKVMEIISHARTPIAKPAEATDNSASDETATDDEAVSLEDILG